MKAVGMTLVFIALGWLATIGAPAGVSHTALIYMGIFGFVIGLIWEAIEWGQNHPK